MLFSMMIPEISTAAPIINPLIVTFKTSFIRMVEQQHGMEKLSSESYYGYETNIFSLLLHIYLGISCG